MRNSSLLMLFFMAATVMSSKVASAQQIDHGKQVYENICSACHQPDGKGLIGVAPPLTDSLGSYLKSEAGQNYLMSVLLIGLNGKIAISGGESFNGVMPPQGHLNNQDLADVATYVAVKLNGKENLAFNPNDFQNARSAKINHKQLREVRRKLINE